MAWRTSPIGAFSSRSFGHHDRLDGEGHIGPGIAVGDGIDVQAIDDVAIGVQEIAVGGDRRSQAPGRQRQRRAHR